MNLFSAFPTGQGEPPGLAQSSPGGEIMGLAVWTGIDQAGKGPEFRVPSFRFLFFHFEGMKISALYDVFASPKNFRRWSARKAL